MLSYEEWLEETGKENTEDSHHKYQGYVKDIKEKAKVRFKEIESILENNLYTGAVEEGDLLNERDFLEELFFNDN